MLGIWRELISAHAFVRPQLRMRARSLTLSRPSSGLALFTTFILSQSMLSLLNITGVRISPACVVIPILSMGVKKFLRNPIPRALTEGEN